MNFLQSGYGLRLLDDVHDAAVAARGQNDQALALQVVRGSQLRAELVRDRASRLLVGRQTVRVATETVADPNCHLRWRQQLLECCLRHLASGESMVRNQRRGGCSCHPELGPLQRLAVEHAEVALHRWGGPGAGAKTFLAADEEGHVGLQPSLARA